MSVCLYVCLSVIYFVLVYNESIHQKEQIACVYNAVNNVYFCEATDSIQYLDWLSDCLFSPYVCRYVCMYVCPRAHAHIHTYIHTVKIDTFSVRVTVSVVVDLRPAGNIVAYRIRRFAKVNIIYRILHTCNLFLLMYTFIILIYQNELNDRQRNNETK